MRPQHTARIERLDRIDGVASALVVCSRVLIGMLVAFTLLSKIVQL